jgi:hypothetical protein
VNVGGWWLEHNAARAMRKRHGYSRLALYVRPGGESSAPSRERVTFEEGLELSYLPLSRTTTAGRALGLDLRWAVGARPPSESYKVFAHLIDKGGEIWSQRDGKPQNGTRPFEKAAPGETLMDRRALLIPEETPPGQYRVRVGVYHAQSGRKLQIVEGAEGESPWCFVAHVELVEE